MNVNVSSSKEKEGKLENKSMLVLKKDKVENNFMLANQAKGDPNTELVMKLKKIVEEHREREAVYQSKLQKCEEENKHLK